MNSAPPDKVEPSESEGFFTRCVQAVSSKILGIMGLEFTEFGGIRHLAKISLVPPTYIPSLLLGVQDRVQGSLKRQLRQAITGDPDKRIRDSLGESHVQTRIKQVDAASFMLGVAITYLIEWIVLCRPTHYPNLYYTLMAVLLTNRFFTYRATKEHFFMLDFCYALNLSTVLQTTTCVEDSGVCVSWFKANFALAHGPIAWAIVCWKNSLVFHSADKVTSFAIHIMPSIFYYLIRWEPSMYDGIFSRNDFLTYSDIFTHPLLIYVTWQIFYLVVQFTVIDLDPTLVTSLRYLVNNDSGKPATRWGYTVFKKFGLIGDDETLDPFSKKTTLLFVGFQLIYVLLCLLPLPIFYSYQTANELFIIVIVLVGIWNAGSYYIQIFSQRYNDKFEKGSDRMKSD